MAILHQVDTQRPPKTRAEAFLAGRRSKGATNLTEFRGFDGVIRQSVRWFQVGFARFELSACDAIAVYYIMTLKQGRIRARRVYGPQ